MVNKEDAKQQIRGLLEKYDKVVEEKRFGKYTEEETKKDFILPLFRALGWNVEDSSEVRAEETISKTRGDYSFRINGIPKFFLEAKKLKEDLDRPEFAEQAINYAWHKDCTWAVLTDFDQGVKIFNAEWKTADLRQSMFFSIDRQQFLEQFDQLWLLSRESFEQGLLDKEAEKWGKKSKKRPVGEQLLNDLTTWRAKLSKDILARNKDKRLTEEDLDEAVQRIIDRLIFIRNCEDRKLEEKTLLSVMREWGGKGKGTLAERIIDVFGHFDAEYNSKLFQKHLCDKLDVSNQVLEEIINGLDHTEDKTIKYDFSALDADVLGNVYEQYLGHILKKTTKRAIVTEKHAYRKEQGIYYTPTYIVDYIVRNTLGELLRNKKVDAEKIRVLDPACGSGSFLIKAFDVLNEYHSKKDKDYTQTRLDVEAETTFTKKVEILKNNIFGVDLDAKAVEIAQLNLLLKIAEKKRRLPMLQQNIKCGNSLIDNPEIAGDKAFKWKEEFKEIISRGGFDVVVGNPPYVRGRELPKIIRDYLRDHFDTPKSEFDIYAVFIERSIKLLKQNARLGFIVSNKFLITEYGLSLREFILKTCAIQKLVDVSNLPIFKDASVYPIILILEKEPDEARRNKTKIDVIKVTTISQGNFIGEEYVIPQKQFLKNANFAFDINISHNIKKIVDKLYSGYILLGDFCYLPRGFTTNNDARYVSKKHVDGSTRVLRGGNIHRYYTTPSNEYFNLALFRKEQSVNEDLLKTKKLLIAQTAMRPRVTLDTGDLCLQTVYFIVPKSREFDLFYIIAILNSKLINWFYFTKFEQAHVAGGYLRFISQYLKQVPIKIIPLEKQQPTIKLVSKMLSLNERLSEIGNKKTDERARIEEEINRTDAEIDELIYKLYGITDAEKKIIEESLK